MKFPFFSAYSGQGREAPVSGSYAFQEYPKWVTPEDGKPLIVQDAEEEARVLGKRKVLKVKHDA